MSSGKYARLALMVVAMLVLGLCAQVGRAAADDKKDEKKEDATGTWKWTAAGRNGQTADMTLKLKQEGEKLTGTIARGTGAEAEISDGTIKGGEIAFKVVRKRNDQEIVTKYEGKLDGDTIKGKSSSERNGQTRTSEFEAKREKA